MKKRPAPSVSADTSDSNVQQPIPSDEQLTSIAPEAVIARVGQPTVCLPSDQNTDVWVSSAGQPTIQLDRHDNAEDEQNEVSTRVSETRSATSSARMPTKRVVIVDDKIIPVVISMDIALADVQAALTPLFPHIARSSPTITVVDDGDTVVERIAWSKKMGTNGDGMTTTFAAIRHLPTLTLRVDQLPLPTTLEALASGALTIDQGMNQREQLASVEAIIDHNAQMLQQRGNTRAKKVCECISLLESVPVQTAVHW